MPFKLQNYASSRIKASKRPLVYLDLMYKTNFARIEFKHQHPSHQKIKIKIKQNIEEIKIMEGDKDFNSKQQNHYIPYCSCLNYLILNMPKSEQKCI